MTARELIDLAGRHPAALAALFLLSPLAALLLGWIHGRGSGGVAPWRYLYSALVYLTCVPGVAAAVVTGYTLFFTHENLLDKNLFVYLLPVLSMAATLVLIGKNVRFEEVPGFDRLSGLMVLIAVTCVTLLAIRKTFVGIFFVGSLAQLAVVGAGLFALLKWGAHALFRRSDEPREKPPFSA